MLELLKRKQKLAWKHIVWTQCFFYLLIYLFSLVQNFIYEPYNDATNNFVMQETKIMFQPGQISFDEISTRSKSKNKSD